MSNLPDLSGLTQLLATVNAVLGQAGSNDQGGSQAGTGSLGPTA